MSLNCRPRCHHLFHRRDPKALEAMGAEVVAVNHRRLPFHPRRPRQTLHPKVFGGILNRRDLAEDVAHMEQYQLPHIDLVIVDLTHSRPPSRKAGRTSKSSRRLSRWISLIRAAAKDFEDVVIVPSQDDYGTLLDLLENGEELPREERQALATRAFRISSHTTPASTNGCRRCQCGAIERVGNDFQVLALR